jgi:hypothetical protein
MSAAVPGTGMSAKKVLITMAIAIAAVAIAKNAPVVKDYLAKYL